MLRAEWEFENEVDAVCRCGSQKCWILMLRSVHNGSLKSASILFIR